MVGDGHVGTKGYKLRSGDTGKQRYPRLSVGMCDQSVIETLARAGEFSINTKILPSGKEFFIVDVVGIRAKRFLHLLHPHVGMNDRGYQMEAILGKPTYLPPTLEWAAGLFAAEGSTYVYTNRQRSTPPKMGLCMQMNDPRAMKAFSEVMQCPWRTTQSRSVVSLYGRDAEIVADKLLPHLKGTDKERQILATKSKLTEVVT